MRRLQTALGSLSLLAPLVLTGCDAQRIVETPPHRPRLAVYGEFSPDQFEWRIQVTRTSPIGGARGGAPVDDALVTVTPEGGGGAAFVLTGTGRGVYTSPAAAPAPGQRFRVRVEAPGLPVATALGEVPRPVENLSVRIEQLDSPDAPSGRATLAVAFSDAPGRGDVYEINAIVDDGFPGLTPFTSPHPAFPRARLEEGLDGRVNTNRYGALFDDATFDGRTFSATLQVNRRLAYAYGVQLERLSRPVYLFRRSVEALEEADGQSLPFTEPIVPYSNIEGGVGLFGGFLRQSAQAVLDEITPARVAGTYEAVSIYRLGREGQTQRGWYQEGARLTLTLGADGQVSGTRVWPEPASGTVIPLQGTYTIDRGRIRFQVEPLLDEVTCRLQWSREVYCVGPQLILTLKPQ